MLTTNDYRWLEGRKVMCPRCDHYRDHIGGRSACYRGMKAEWLQAECRFFCRSDLLCDFEDVAEFEARVAARIAQDAHNCALDEMLCQHREGDKPQGWYVLRDARLAAEEEMPI